MAKRISQNACLKNNHFPRKMACRQTNLQAQGAAANVDRNTNTFLHPRVQKAEIMPLPSKSLPRFVDLLRPFFRKRGQFFFGPVLALLYWSHSIMPPKLAMEVCEIRKAAFRRHI
jgi:hypothetical protein